MMFRLFFVARFSSNLKSPVCSWQMEIQYWKQKHTGNEYGWPIQISWKTLYIYVYVCMYECWVPFYHSLLEFQQADKCRCNELWILKDLYCACYCNSAASQLSCVNWLLQILLIGAGTYLQSNSKLTKTNCVYGYVDYHHSSNAIFHGILPNLLHLQSSSKFIQRRTA